MAKAAKQEPVPQPPPTLQPLRALTPKQWRENKVLRQDLERMLNSPTMQMAFDTLLRQAMPNAAPSSSVVPGVSAEAMTLETNNRYHNRSGFTQFHRALFALTSEQKDHKMKSAWGD